VVAAAGQLPTCQDTGTAIVLGKKGQYVLTDGDDAAAFRGDFSNLSGKEPALFADRAAGDVQGEKHRDNLPAQIDLLAEPGDEYKFLFIAKGGGSANKAYLYQSTPAV
jgi:fumarate hydratase class I